MGWAKWCSFFLGAALLLGACAHAGQVKSSAQPVYEAPPALSSGPGPDLSSRIEAYEAWPGQCTSYEDTLSEGVRAGVQLFREDALQCSLRQVLAGRDWATLSKAEQVAVAPVLARLYLVTGDERVRDHDFCGHETGPMAEVIVNTFVDSVYMEHAPPPYELEKPRAGGERMAILERYLYCSPQADGVDAALEPPAHGPDFSKPRPAYDDALKVYQAWSGQCDMMDEVIRLQVEAGAKLAWPDALQCLFTSELAGRDWHELSQPERVDLLDEVIALSVLTQDPDILALEVCDLSRDIRWTASQIVFEQFQEALTRPSDRRAPVPFDFVMALHQRIEC